MGITAIAGHNRPATAAATTTKPATDIRAETKPGRVPPSKAGQPGAGAGLLDGAGKGTGKGKASQGGADAKAGAESTKPGANPAPQSPQGSTEAGDAQIRAERERELADRPKAESAPKDKSETKSESTSKSDDKPKPQTQFETKAFETDDPSNESTIPYQVSKDVRKDAPIPDVTAVQWNDPPLLTDDPGANTYSSQVVVEGPNGTVATSEIDADNTFADVTDPEVENEVVVDGWKYTFQVQFYGDHYDVSKVVLIDAQPVD